MTTARPDPSNLDALGREVRALQRALDSARETAESEDGLIKATVSGRGELLELELDPRIYRGQDSDVLARAILDTVREAVERARNDAYETAGPHLLQPGVKPESVDIEFEPFLRELERAAGQEA